MDLNKKNIKEGQVECANCRQQFMWDNAYRNTDTPGSMSHIPIGMGLWYPRVFCPNCGALVAVWHITRAKDFNEWIWFGDNALINSGKSLPPSPITYWGKSFPRQLVPHYDEHKLDIVKVKRFETEKESAVKIPSEDQKDWKQSYEKAFEFLKERNYTKALELVQKAINNGLPKQEYAKILGLIGEYYLLDEKDVDSALKYFLSSIKTHFSGFWKSHIYLAFIYEEMGNNQKANQEFADAERANPHESLIPEFALKIRQIIRRWAEKQINRSKESSIEAISIISTKKSEIIQKLQTLRSTILELPHKYPSRTKVIGTNISQMKEQIPILCSYIDDVITALKHTYSKMPITNYEIANGLNTRINTILNPGFLASISSVLDRMGIIELEGKMRELRRIANNIRSLENIYISEQPKIRESISIEPEQTNVLKNLKEIIGKTIPLVKQIRLKSFGVSIEGDNIVGLGLYKCGLTALPESIGSLKMLRELNLANNKLTTLPESIGNLKSLKTLWLQKNELLTLPESIGSLKSLQTLDLIGNKLTTLPESMGNLKSLNSLYLKGNELTTLPNSIENLSLLKELNVALNKLTILPEWIDSLKSLQTLDLIGNKLIALPESIGNLKSLKTLWLQRNELSTLPESIGNLKMLKELILANNKLTTLPESIGNLKSLNNLHLKGNELTALPNSIENLSLLKELNVALNKLTILPKWIDSLKSLNKLYLKGNELTALPNSIGNLSLLKELNVALNKLKPKKIKFLKNLERRGVKIYK